MTPTPTEQARSPHLLRRLLAVVFGMALVGGLTTACSSGNSDDSSSDSSASNSSYYPHTMTMPYGEVTIDKKPERILALNGAVADHLITLGVTPMKVAADPKGLGNTPWIKENIETISEEGLYSAGEFNVEQIAKFEPDLIVGMPYQFQTEDNFNKLTAIAPTVFQDSLDTTSEWKASFLATAEAVNKVSEAEQNISQIQEEYSAVGKNVGNIEGITYSFSAFQGDKFGYGDGSVFEMFGMSPAKNQDNRTQKTVSLENLNQLDAGLVVIFPPSEESKEKLQSLEGFNNSSFVREGRTLLVNLAEAQAINTPAPLALDWLLEQLTPSIEALGK